MVQVARPEQHTMIWYSIWTTALNCYKTTGFQFQNCYKVRIDVNESDEIVSVEVLTFRNSNYTARNG